MVYRLRRFSGRLVVHIIYYRDKTAAVVILARVRWQITLYTVYHATVVRTKRRFIPYSISKSTKHHLKTPTLCVQYIYIYIHTYIYMNLRFANKLLPILHYTLQCVYCLIWLLCLLDYSTQRIKSFIQKQPFTIWACKIKTIFYCIFIVMCTVKI